MSLKERFVDRHVLDTDDAIRRIHFHDSVDEQQRVAVRQDLENLLDVQGCLFQFVQPLSARWRERELLAPAQRFRRDSVGWQ